MKLLGTDAHDVTAEVFTAEDGSHAFTAFSVSMAEADEPVGVIVTADGAVAEAMVADHGYVHLHVVTTPEVAARLLEGKIR